VCFENIFRAIAEAFSDVETLFVRLLLDRILSYARNVIGFLTDSSFGATGVSDSVEPMPPDDRESDQSGKTDAPESGENVPVEPTTSANEILGSEGIVTEDVNSNTTPDQDRIVRNESEITGGSEKSISSTEEVKAHASTMEDIDPSFVNTASSDGIVSSSLTTLNGDSVDNIDTMDPGKISRSSYCHRFDRMDRL